MATTTDNVTQITLSDAGVSRHTKHNNAITRRNARRILELTEADDPYTMTDWEVDLVIVTLNAANMTINLPTASSSIAGMEIAFKTRTMNSKTATVDAGSGKTIDTTQTKALAGNYAEQSIVCDGSNWLVLTGGW